MLNTINRIYEKIKTPTLLPILVTLCCYVTIDQMKAEAGFTVCISLIALCYVSAVYFRDSINCARTLFDTWWKIVLAIILFVYFDFSIYGYLVIEPLGIKGYRFDKILFVLVAIIWTIPMFLGLVYALSRFLSMPLSLRGGLSLKFKIIAFGLLMVNYLIWLYAFNPAITSPDSSLFVRAHQMFVMPMEDWSPPFYTIVLSLLIKICDSVTFIIIVQCILFSLLIVRIVDRLLAWGCNPHIVLLLYIIWGWSCNNILQMITLWKDIPYMISITWLTFLLGQYLVEKKRTGIMWHIELIISMVFTSLFRQNGLLPVLAVCIILGIGFLARRHYISILSIVIFLTIFCLIKGPVYSLYNVQSSPGLKYFALANDIVGTYYDSDESSEDVIRMVDEITKGEPENYNYDPYFTWYNSESLKEYSVPEFLSVYIDTFIRHPRSITFNFFRRNSALWSIVKPQREMAGCVNYKKEYDTSSSKFGYPKRNPNFLTGFLSRLADLPTSISLYFILAWRIGVFSLILFVVIVMLICNRRFEGLLVFVPAMFNELGLYLANGWPDYRYFWPIAVMSLFIVPFISVYNASLEKK